MSRILKKIWVYLVVDVSGSLSIVGSNLNKALKEMKEIITQNEEFSGCEINFSLITFNELTDVKIDLRNIYEIKDSEFELVYTGLTNPAPALEYAAKMAMKRYSVCKNDDGRDCMHPIIFFFTDGRPEGNESYQTEYERVAKNIKDLEARKKLSVVAAGYGYPDIANLKLLTENVIMMEGNDVKKLEKFFKILIPMTLLTGVTNTSWQIRKAFRKNIMR